MAAIKERWRRCYRFPYGKSMTEILNHCNLSFITVIDGKAVKEVI